MLHKLIRLQVIEQFKTTFPASLITAMNPLMEFVSSNRENLNIAQMVSKMTTFLTQFPTKIIKELQDFETLRDETLNLQNIKKFMSVASSREEKKQMIKQSMTKFFKEFNDIHKAFQSIVSPDFIDMVLYPLFTVMEGLKTILKEIVTNLKCLDEFPNCIHNLIVFLLSSDKRMINIFKPPPLIACFCGCFINAPDILEQLQSELQKIKSSIQLEVIEEFVISLAKTIKQSVGQEEAKIRTLIQTLENQLKQSKTLKESLSKQQKVFDQVNGEIEYMEQNILNELDELLDSPLVKKLDEVKDKVVGVFSGLFGKKNKE